MLKANSSGVLLEDIPIVVTDSEGTPLSGKTFTDINGYWSTTGQSSTTALNESGDTLRTLTSTEGMPYYGWSTNDTLCVPPCTLTITGGGAGIKIINTTFDLVAVKPGEGVFVVTVGTGSTTTNIVSPDFSQANTANWIRGIGICPNATNADNRRIFFTVQTFTTATDTVGINQTMAAALSSGDVCYFFPGK